MVNHVLVSCSSDCKSPAGNTHLQVGSTRLQAGSLTAPWRCHLHPRKRKPSGGSPYAASLPQWARALERQVCWRVMGVSKSMTHQDLTFTEILGKPGQKEDSTEKAPNSVLNKLGTLSLSPSRRMTSERSLKQASCICVRMCMTHHKCLIKCFLKAMCAHRYLYLRVWP